MVVCVASRQPFLVYFTDSKKVKKLQHHSDRNSILVSVTALKLALFGYGCNRKVQFRPTPDYGRKYNKVSA